MNPQQRTEALNAVIFQWTVKGFVVETVIPPNAILVKKDTVNHVLHLILSFFTCGLWPFVWIFLVLFSKDEKYQLFVDENGNVSATKIKV